MAELQDLEGRITYDHEPRGTAWLQKWRDRVYSHRVINLWISSRVLSDEYFAKVSEFEHLESLTISKGNAVSDEALARLAPITTLRSLSLGNTHVHASGKHALKQLRIEKLNLSTNHFGTNETNWIKDLEELKKLELRAPVTDSDLESLAALPNLEELTITSDGVTDAGLVHLARCHNLRKLNLLCPVSDAGMVHLIPLKRLERLSCRPNRQPYPFDLVDRLFMSVRAKYHQTPLVDAVRVMSKITQVPLRIDEAALQAAGIAAGSIMLTVDESCDLRHALDAMLAPHALVCIHDPGGLLITTQEEAARRRPGTTRLLEALPKLVAYVPW